MKEDRKIKRTWKQTKTWKKTSKGKDVEMSNEDYHEGSKKLGSVCFKRVEFGSVL